MNKRNLRIGLGVAAMLGAALAVAHPQGKATSGHQMDPQARVAKLTKALELYPDQVPQVEAIFAETRAQMQAIRETNTLAERDQAWAEMQIVREETRERLATVLTAEQLQKMDEMRREFRSQRGHRGHHRDGSLKAVQPIQPPEEVQD